MPQFTRSTFSTGLFNDQDLHSMLGQICVRPEDAKAGDILAIVVPLSNSEEEGKVRGFIGEVVQAQADGTALRVPWYVLAMQDQNSEQLKLLASAISRITLIWCESLWDKISSMSSPSSEPDEYDLFVGPGFGFLLYVYRPADDYEEMSAEIYETDEDIQGYIDERTAIALPKITTSHQRLQIVPDAQSAEKLAELVSTLTHPHTFEVIRPEPLPLAAA